MMQFDRTAAPSWLIAKAPNWNSRFVANRDKNANFKFSWTTHNKQKINKLLLPLLSAMTQQHCSFCDSFPMGEIIPNTIEHFRPKSSFPHLAYEWTNLYLCCGNCQEKNENYSPLLLQPDAANYNFHDYFSYNFRTGELEPNLASSTNRQDRAAKTIELYKLNEFGRPQSRKRELDKYTSCQKNPVNTLTEDDFSYRYMYS